MTLNDLSGMSRKEENVCLRSFCQGLCTDPLLGYSDFCDHGVGIEELAREVSTNATSKYKRELSAMRKRCVLVAIVFILVPVVGVALWYPFAHREKSISKKYALIRDGMTVAEVESLLGGQLIETHDLNPAMEVMEGATPEDKAITLGSRKGAQNRRANATLYKLWNADSWWIGVWFDMSGDVVDKEGVIYFENGSPSYMQRLLVKLGL